MKPRYLKIEGFLSYQQPVEIDFTEFDLACITGENGAGKSSILDAMTWVLFGKARQSNESLINLQSDEAIVSFSFEYSGESYLVKRSNRRGKPARLALKTPDLDLTERTIRDTQDKIESILKINYDTFVHAVFFLQGESDQFVSASSGQRKQVLFDILGLAAWEDYRLKAAAEIKRIEKSMEQARGSIQVLEEGTRKGPEVARDLEIVEDELPALEKELEAAQAALDEGQRKMDLWQAEKDELNRLSSQGREAEEKAKSITTRLENLTSQQEENHKIISRKEQITKDYGRSREVNYMLEDLQTRRIEYAKLINDLAVAESRLLEIEKDKAEIPKFKESITIWEKQAEEAAEYKSFLDGKKEKAIKLDADAKNLISKKRDIQDQVAGLAGHESCPLCEQDLKNPEALTGKLQKEIASIEATVSEITKELDGDLTERKEVANKLKIIEGAEALIGPARSKQAMIFDAVEAFDYDRIDEINAAVISLNYSQEKMTELKNEAEGIKAAPRDYGLLEGAEKAIEGLEVQAAGLRQDLADAQATAKESMDQFANKESLQKENDITDNDLITFRYDVKAVNTKLQVVNQRIGELQQVIKTIAEQQVKLKEIKDQEKDNTDLHQKYSMLHEAFSKKGVPALLVEQALPQIEAKANQLLGRLSDGQMAVHFITQKAYSDSSRDDMKETLDIEIQDQAGIRDYEMYSGGESFRINFAIRMALSNVLANRSGAKLRTLIVDEGFGSQDAAGRDKLINAINTVKADYDKVLVITHIPEVIEAFPTQLRVEKTAAGSQVRLI